MHLSFEGRHVAITGAGSGIGAAMARGFASAGAKVEILDLNEDAASHVASHIKSGGGTAEVHICDVTDREAVSATFERIGPVDTLINNAGFARDKSLTRMTEADWSSVLSVILDGAFNCTQAVVPAMRSAGFGRLINISSRAHLGNPGQANYSAAKAGIIGLTRSNALEFGKFGITANAIAPGLIDTPLVRAMEGFDAMAERFAANTPIRRIGQPEDVANAALFLASDQASYITGDVIHVTGGRYG